MARSNDIPSPGRLPGPRPAGEKLTYLAIRAHRER